MTISQYANSPRFEKLRSGLVNIFDKDKTLQDWFRIVFNLKTAQGFGLDIWGIILNQGRSFVYYNTDTQQDEYVYLQGAQTVDGVYYSEEEIEEMYRQVLFLKAMSNITNATLKSLNDMLLYYYQDRGRAYALNFGTMEIRFVFEFPVNKLEKAIFSSNIMPRPTGVLANLEWLTLGKYFGFIVPNVIPADQSYKPFDQGTFYR